MPEGVRANVEAASRCHWARQTRRYEIRLHSQVATLAAPASRARRIHLSAYGPMAGAVIDRPFGAERPPVSSQKCGTRSAESGGAARERRGGGYSVRACHGMPEGTPWRARTTAPGIANCDAKKQVARTTAVVVRASSLAGAAPYHRVALVNEELIPPREKPCRM